MNPNLVFLNSFLDIAVFKKLETGKVIGKTDEVPTKIYMLISGVMRAYLSSETGKEYNKNFFMPFSFVGAFTGLIKKQPSKLVY